jgi:Holliday junction DNA helicase RuvB
VSRPPKTFAEFIGQRRVCAYEQRVVDGARQNNHAVLSQLLVGASGMGKSTLAAAIAKDRGAQIVTLLAGRETSPVDVCDALLRLRDCDVLFIDEIHALSRPAQEIVSNALSTKQVPKRTEKGSLDRTAVDNLATQFTVIAATTDPGLLASALLTRLQHVTLEAYSVDDLKRIGVRVAEQRELKISAQALRRIGEVAQGLPRTMERLIEQLPTFFPKVHEFKIGHVRELLKHLGIDDRGLTDLQRRYIAALGVASSKCRSLSSIAGRLGCDAAYVRREIEPHLINEGYVEIEARGRVLTEKGTAIVDECIPVPAVDAEREVDGEDEPDNPIDVDGESGTGPEPVEVFS